MEVDHDELRKWVRVFVLDTLVVHSNEQLTADLIGDITQSITQNIVEHFINHKDAYESKKAH